MKLNIEIKQKIVSVLLQQNRIHYFADKSAAISHEYPPHTYFCELYESRPGCGTFVIRLNERHFEGHYNLVQQENKLQFVMDGYYFEAKFIEESYLQKSLSRGHMIISQLPGKILRVLVQAGDLVKKGQVLLVQEAMKMEHSMTAPADRRIKAVLVKEKDQVKEDQVLVQFEEDA